MSYQLYRRTDGIDSDAGSVLLGQYADFEEALTARDEDTVRLFETTMPGEVMMVRHDIVGPGASGPTSFHPVTTAIERRTLNDAAEIDEVRGWLKRIHAFAG
jgi:hypothetical protein